MGTKMFGVEKVLQELYGNPLDTSLNGLVKRTGLAKNTVKRILRKLCEQGKVTKQLVHSPRGRYRYNEWKLKNNS